jgi:hypothetical protein
VSPIFWPPSIEQVREFVPSLFKGLKSGGSLRRFAFLTWSRCHLVIQLIRYCGERLDDRRPNFPVGGHSPSRSWCRKSSWAFSQRHKPANAAARNGSGLRCARNGSTRRRCGRQDRERPALRPSWKGTAPCCRKRRGARKSGTRADGRRGSASAIGTSN